MSLTLLMKIKSIGFKFALVFFTFSVVKNTTAQLFPNPADLSTGQGAPGTIDPLWQASPWYPGVPPNPIGLTYIPTLINNNCAPGAWVDPASLPAPVNNGNWITGSDDDCATNINDGYRYFRLTLNLPPDCNGFSVTVPGNYILNLVGYADNAISDVFVNGVSTGISGGGFSAGTQLNISLVGPWVVGTNYVDVLVFNAPSGPGNINPYGLLLVADANATNAMDTDGDGITNLNDLCPCDPGTNPYGCVDPTLNNCDIDLIRQTFTNAGCVEMPGCSSDCSIYFLNPTSLTGADAQNFAQSLGANLVSLQSQTENDCVLSSLNNLGYASNEVVWIGFNDEATEGTFGWYDQAPITYTNWAPGEPNNSGGDEDCVQIYPAGASPGTWNDLPCTSSNSMSIIEVNLCPVTSIGADQIICLGETIDIDVEQTLFGSSPYSYLWNTGSTNQTISVSPTTADTFSVLTTDIYHCEAFDTMYIAVLTPPTANFSAADNCIGTNSIFTNTSNPIVNIIQNNWSFDDGNSSAQVNPSHLYAQDGTYDVTLIVTDNNGCKDTITQSITVFPTVSSAVTGSICNGEAYIFGGNSYTIAGTYVNNLQNVNGCDSIVTLTLSELPTPQTPIVYSNSPLECPGDELMLSMETVPNAIYFWTGPNGFTSQNQTVNFPVSENNTGIYNGYITVNGCPSPIQSELVVANGSYTLTENDFPNVISANNDGINDYLDLDQYFSSCLTYEFTLINRWGGLVYTQKLGEIPFQGKDLNGNNLEDGVYFYTLEYGDNKQQGFITLVR